MLKVKRQKVLTSFDDGGGGGGRWPPCNGDRLAAATADSPLHCYCTPLYCTALHCTLALACTALHCFALQRDSTAIYWSRNTSLPAAAPRHSSPLYSSSSALQLRRRSPIWLSCTLQTLQFTRTDPLFEQWQWLQTCGTFSG